MESDLQRRRLTGWALQGAAVLLVLVSDGPGALAFINVQFTPVKLVKDSRTILTGTIAATSDPNEWKLQITEVLKGEKGKDDQPAALSLTRCEEQDAESIRKLLTRNAKGAVILFIPRGPAEMPAYMQVAGTWLELLPAGQGRFSVSSVAKKMSGVFAGGTDMLIRMSRYILADANATVPVSVGVSWMRQKSRLGKVPGRIGGMEALELKGDKRAHLFVASDKGDRLYRAKENDEAFEELTAQTKLDTRSRRFAWMDINGDGQVDLVSWDGTTIALRELARDGAFKPLAGARDYPSGRDCLGLSPCSLPSGATPAILIGAPDLPVLLYRDGNGTWATTSLPDGEAVARAGRASSACVVADLDNDGCWDVLQPRQKGGVLWKGKAGGFHPPVRSEVIDGGQSSCLALGDFDQDGSLDIFISGSRKNDLWENDGKGGFKPVSSWAGSLGYKSAPGASDCRAMDLNHDGRPDLCLLYAGGEMAYHFSRGYRCFGEEGELRLTGGQGGDGSHEGQVACAVADFNGDGSLDLAVAFSDGEVCCFYNDVFNKPVLKVGLKKGAIGPVTASVWQGDKFPVCVGTMPIQAVCPGVNFCLRSADECTVRWSSPGKCDRVTKARIPGKLPEGSVEVVLEP